MKYHSIIEQCNSTNNPLSVVDGSIKVENAATLPQSMGQAIIDNSPRIIEALQRDEMAGKNGLFIGITGTLYTWSVSRKSTVYLEFINDEWVVWRETYEPNRRKAIRKQLLGEKHSTIP